jgi:hypothetical protein
MLIALLRERGGQGAAGSVTVGVQVGDLDRNDQESGVVRSRGRMPALTIRMHRHFRPGRAFSINLMRYCTVIDPCCSSYAFQSRSMTVAVGIMVDKVLCITIRRRKADNHPIRLTPLTGMRLLPRGRFQWDLMRRRIDIWPWDVVRSVARGCRCGLRWFSAKLIRCELIVR